MVVEERGGKVAEAAVGVRVGAVAGVMAEGRGREAQAGGAGVLAAGMVSAVRAVEEGSFCGCVQRVG